LSGFNLLAFLLVFVHKYAMKRIEIPLWIFNLYWLGWFAISAVAVYLGSEYLLWPLVIAFLAAETLGIRCTVKDAGTLTDVTAKYVPEDLTFIFMGLMLWRLSQWLSGSLWVVWALAAWLVQHFIVHYQKIDVAPGWNAPRKIERWYKFSVEPRNDKKQAKAAASGR
jgi:hypothetical protein